MSDKLPSTQAPQQGRPLRRVVWSDVPPQPWRNGKGLTRELIAWPDLASWRLRLSVADIVEDGPFSAWPGVMRQFCVLDGAGVVLRWSQDRQARLEPGTPPLRFDGEDAPWAELIDGPTRDLNLMTREGLDASLVPHRGGSMHRPWGCFTAEAGRLSVDGEGLDLAAGTLVWLERAAAQAQFDGRGWWLA